MKNTDSTKSDSFVDEMEINFHMFGALVLNWVGGEVDSTDIIAADEAGSVERMVEFLKKLPEPGNLSNTICNGSVFSFSAGSGDGGLTFRGLGHKAVTKKESVTRGGTASVRASGPIRIGVNHKLIRSSTGNNKSNV
jgi:hypothetical protein